MLKPCCYLCNKKQSILLYKINDYKIVKCSHCGFVFAFPKPTNIFLSKFYTKFKANIFEKNQIAVFDSIHSFKIIDKYKGERLKLLDIGCGNGVFIKEAVYHNWLPVGIDTSEILVNYIKENTNIEVHKININNYKTADKYDLITMNQVIEHFTNPTHVINRCKQLLNDSGLLYVATPNIDSYVSKIRKQEFDYLMPPEHLSYFNKTTLTNLLEKNGFKVLYIGSWSYPVDLAGLIKYILGKRKNINSHVTTPIVPRNKVKLIKYYFFDRFICVIFYRLLNFNYGGTNLEILAQKI